MGNLKPDLCLVQVSGAHCSPTRHGTVSDNRKFPTITLASAAMNEPASEREEASGDCERTRRHAQEYLDGELEESISTAIAIHIVACQRCGRRITFEAAFLRTIARGRGSGSAPLPAAVEEQVVSLLEQWRSGDA